MTKKTIIQTCIIFCISLIATNTILMFKGYEYLKSFSDAFFIVGALNLFLSALLLLGTKGTYDSFGYSFYYVLGGFKTKKYEDYYDYIETKKRNRTATSNYILWVFLIIGIVFTLIGIILSLFI